MVTMINPNMNNGYEQNGRLYKTPVGQIPKIVNNFKPLTDNQKLFFHKMSDFKNQLILCHGIAGTGKTYVSI